MKSALVRQLIPVLLILALVQFACLSSAGSSAPASPAPASSGQSGAQSTAVTATATGHGTPEEAKAMLQKAIEHYNTVGRTQALADFNNRVAPFFDRDLYVACIDSTLTIVANGGFPNLVGSKTEPLSRAAWDAASTTKVSSTNYSYTDPLTGTTVPKTLYYEKVGTDVCGVGAYHP